jgi:hypothetical protein
MNTRLLLSIFLLTSACIDADIRLKLCDATLSDDHPCDSDLQAGNTNAGQCCWDTQYCAKDATGKAKCMLKVANAKGEGQECTINFQGRADQNDDCGPGLVCLTVENGGGTNRCMRLCESYLECNGGVRCLKRPGYSVTDLTITKKVCDPNPHLECGSTAECCTPLRRESEPMVPCSEGQICRLVVDRTSPASLSSPNSFTTCDYSKGGVRTGAACTGDWDCMESNVCNGKLCRQVCVPGSTDPTLSCSNENAICEKLGEQFGYCTF